LGEIWNSDFILKETFRCFAPDLQPIAIIAISRAMTTHALAWLTDWLEANIPARQGEAEPVESLASLTEKCLLAMVSAGLAPNDIEPAAGQPLELIIRDAFASRTNRDVTGATGTLTPQL
jgi:hypothetical protein